MTLDLARRTIPRPISRSDWLLARRPFFNASAAACLWDRHPYLSAADYAVEKLTGKGQDETRSMRRGRYLESALADWYARETGLFLWEPEALYIADPIMATVDRLTINGPDCLVEIKTTNSYVTEPDQYWVDQTQAEMLCTGIDHAVIVWLDASMDMKVAELDADEAFQLELLKRAERFMAAIELGMLPDWITPDLTAHHIAAVFPDPEGEVELDEQTAALIEDYRDARSIRDAAERTMEQIKSTVAVALGEHAVGTYAGSPVVTFKAIKDSEQIDTKALRADHPDIVEQYLTTRPGGRRFLPVP